MAHLGHPEDLEDMVVLGHPEDMVVLGHLEDMVVLEHPEGLGHLEHQEVVIQAGGLEPIALGICLQRTGSWHQDSPH